MLKLEKLVKQLNEAFKNEKKNSREAYIQRFTRVYTNVEDIHNPKQVKEFIDSISPGSQSPTLRAFVKCLEALGMKVPKIYIQMRRDVKMVEKKHNEFKPKDNPTNFEYSKVKEAFDKMKDGVDKWIVGSYLYLPPLRPSEYVDCFILSKDTAKAKGHNRLIMDDSTLIIENHKTKDIHKTKIIKLNDDYMNLVKKYVFDFYTYSPVFMFAPRKNPAQSPSRFTITRVIKKYVGVSPNDLRNFYVSERIDNPDVSFKDRKLDAYILGHSISTENSTYSKYSVMANSKDLKEKIKVMMKGLDNDTKSELLKALLEDISN